MKNSLIEIKIMASLEMETRLGGAPHMEIPPVTFYGSPYAYSVPGDLMVLPQTISFSLFILIEFLSYIIKPFLSGI